MRGFKSLFALAVAVAVSAFATCAYAVDTPITVPTLGIDWSGTVTGLSTAIGTVIVASLGLWAGIKLVRAAKRFVGGAVSGR